MITAITFYQFLAYAEGMIKYKYLFYLCAYSFVLLPIRYSFERIKPFEEPTHAAQLSMRMKRLKSNMPAPEKTIVFNEPYYVEAMFYIGCVAYPFKADDSTLQYLKAREFTVLSSQSGGWQLR
jgi:4-amino-4-deoxy-L-arabinose transferase